MQFGIHLLQRGLITPDDLVRALAAQQEDQPPLGQIAIEEGLLAVRDVFRVLRVQSDFNKERFGQTAIDLDLLNRREVAELLLVQGDRRKPLEQVLVELEIIDQETCDRELTLYRQQRENQGAGKKVEITRLPGPQSAAENPAATEKRQPIGNGLPG